LVAPIALTSIQKNEGEAMRFGTLIIAMTLALPATAARAEPVTLSGDALRQAITGKIVFLNISGFELPIRYAANGACREG
jgi:hypothetical protein